MIRILMLLIAILAVARCTAAMSTQLLEEKSCSRQDTNCKVGVVGAIASIETNGSHAIVEWSVPALEGPVELRFKLKTAVVGDDDQYIVYWLCEGEKDWKSFRRIPFQADGQWHQHRLPLADNGRLIRVRLAFAGPPHRVELAEPTLLTIGAAPLADSSPHRGSLPPTIEIHSETISCKLDCKTHCYVIHDSVTDRHWTSEPVSQWLALVGVDRPDERNLNLQLYDRFTHQTVAASVSLSEKRGVRFSIAPSIPQLPLDAACQYPPRFYTDMAAGQFVFCDRSCGVRLDQSDPTYAAWPLRVYGNTHCLDMPWVGLYDKVRGDGCMLLIETPADAEVAFVSHEDGRHWPEVRWRNSMDAFRYPRVASLRFTHQGGYVALAKEYRRHLQESGRFKSMREKLIVKPQADQLRGAASIWGGGAAKAFIEQMRPLGIDRGIIGNCKDPETVAWLNSLGYLTGRYDSYTDILEGSLDFQRDDVDRVAVRSRPGGPPKLGWKLRTNNEQMYWRSSSHWLGAKHAYVDEELLTIPYSARFIDVAAAAEPLEDYHPNHTFDRRQDLANRRALFDEINRHHLVLGTEHGNDWVTDQIEYFEGTMSGPFWWSSWDAGYLEPPTREQLSPEYLKFGMGYAHRVPLWELVFHDSVVTTWYWGDTAGMLYRAAPELAERKDLMNILYGTPPLIWTNGADYQLPDDTHRLLRTYHETCPLHQVVAFEEMIEHEFLSDDAAVQRTRFSGGTVVVVNFAEDPRTFQTPHGPVVLAPRGYWVEGPGISQTKLWINNAARTVLAKQGYLTVEAAGKEFVANVKCLGRLTAFRMSNERWNVFLEPNCACEINVAGVTGWAADGTLAVRAMDELGRVGAVVATPDEQGIARFRSSDKSWRFALVRTQAEKVTAIVDKHLQESPDQ